MRRLQALALAIGSLACGREVPGAEVTVRAEFAVAASVRCIRLTAVGAVRTASQDFSTSAGQRTQSLALRGVPTGAVMITGTAFDGPCSAPGSGPTWVADAILRTLSAGVTSTFSLLFHPNGLANVTADFKSGAVPGKPANASCLRVSAVGATRTAERSLDLGTTAFTLSDLPVGEVLFVADAFAGPCSGITAASARTWAGTPLRATLAAGTPADLLLELHAVTASVAISPREASPLPGRSVQFAATVTVPAPGQSTAVTWSVQEASGGSVDADGQYTAPALPGTFHVLATSVADPSRSDVATVQVVEMPIAADRATLWNPGLNAVGGIPNRTTIFRTLSPSGGDDTPAINSALSACPPDQVVKLEPGTFNVNGTALVFRSTDCTLRGSGSGAPGSGAGGTRLIKADRDTNPSYAILYVGFDPGQFASSTDLAADAIKGERSLTLVNNPGLLPGEIVLVDHITDDDPQVVWGLNHDPPGGGSRRWFVRQDRSLSQMLEVTAVEGNTVTFATPFHITFRTAFNAQLSRYAQPVLRRTGVEDIYFYGGMGGDGHGNVAVALCAYCWVKNIEAHWSVGTSVGFYATYRSELRDSYIHETPDPNPGGAGYLTGLNFGASDNLIENNIMWYGNKVVVMRGTGGGNVFAYNYTDDAFGSQYPTQPEAGLNAGHYTTPHMELLEGNRSWNYQGDAFWGNSIAITVFRNHLTGIRGAVPPLDAYTFTVNGVTYPYMDLEGRSPVRMERYSYNHNLVGNVLGFSGQMPLSYSSGTYSFAQTGWLYEALTGEPGEVVPMWKLGLIGTDPGAPYDPLVAGTAQRDGNWDWFTESQRWHGIGGQAGSGTPKPLPASLYLTHKPAFFGSNPWPWVDSATGAVYTLPAKARFDAMRAP